MYGYITVIVWGGFCIFSKVTQSRKISVATIFNEAKMLWFKILNLILSEVNQVKDILVYSMVRLFILFEHCLEYTKIKLFMMFDIE